MHKLFGTRRRKIMTLGVAVMLLAATAAVAAWLLSGSGQARTGQFGTAGALYVADASLQDSTLYPGSSNVPVYYAVENSGNDFDVLLTSEQTSAVVDTDPAICASYVSVAGGSLEDISGDGNIVPAGGFLDVVGQATLSASPDLPNECQGGDIYITVTVQGQPAQ